MKGRIIYFDFFDYDEASRMSSSALKRLNQCALILSNYKYPVTADTLKECIAVRWKEVPITQSDSTFMGDRAQITHVGDRRIVRLADGAPAICEELKRKVEKAKQMAASKEDEKATEVTLQAQFDDMIHKVMDVRERGSLIKSDVWRLVSEHICFDSDSFKVVTDDSLNEALKESCNVYCLSKKAEKMMSLHEQAATILQEMMSMAKSESVPEDMSGLFTLIDGKVEITQINYNQFVK